MKLSENAVNIIRNTTRDKPYLKFTVGVLNNGETHYKLYNDTKELPYESHIYETGSIGKLFTTSLLAKLVSEGKMNLDESVNKYIPDLADVKYTPTLKKLATHTAGYPATYPIAKGEVFRLVLKQIGGMIKKKPMKAEEYLHMDYDRMIFLAKEAKLKDKDYAWSYSNYGYGLLGHAISCAIKKPFWDAMNAFLSEDLHLKNTFLGTNSPNILTGYNHLSQNVGNWGLGAEDFLTPAGNISSSAEDLLTFAKMNIEGNPNFLELCHTRYDMKSKHSDMGLGWWIDYKNPNIYYHGGNVDGFAGMIAFDKTKKNAVVLLANVGFYKGREQLFMEILSSL